MVAKVIQIRERNRVISHTMQCLGFSLENTGGNLQAWRMDVAPNVCLLVSTNEGEAYANPDAPIWVWSVYYHDRPDASGGADDGMTLEGAALQAKAHALACIHRTKHQG